MASRCTVLIAARDLLEPLRQRLPADGEVLMFADSEPLRALEAITGRQPSVVALERLFAASPRGTALMNRIKSDPALSDAEVIILSHDNHVSRTVHHWEGFAAKPVAMQRGSRRAPRVKVRPGVEVMVDGNTATLVDLSRVGAQLLSPLALLPNTRVRMTLADEDDIIRVTGVVAWSRFEIPDRVGEPRYRVGIEFSEADTREIDRFCARWKLVVP